MHCKVACRTPAGWFFWEDLLFSTPDRAKAYIERQPEHIRSDLFLVFPGRDGWGRY